MNCPSRTEEPEGTGWNQSPSFLASDLTTRQDLNGIANARVLRRIATGEIDNVVDGVPADQIKKKDSKEEVVMAKAACRHVGEGGMSRFDVVDLNGNDDDGRGTGTGRGTYSSSKWFRGLRKVVVTFGRFVGPGFMVSNRVQII
jgi:metal iron transporter